MKPKKTRLSLAQEQFLRETADAGERGCWDEYPPLKKLIQFGFVKTREAKLGTKAFVTDAGREWLEDH